MKKAILCVLPLLLFLSHSSKAQEYSTAREWNEQILHAISADFARPTVHARNLFHLSIAMYDSWMAYQPNGNTYLLGKTLGNYQSNFSGVVAPDSIEAARETAISFAAYRIIEHRYAESPGIIAISDSIQTLMNEKGYNINNESTDYINGGPAELGNYIASQVIEFGYTDGANELNDYENIYYEPVNPPIEVEEPGNPDIIYPNRWQQISLSVSIDQSGEIVENAPPFLSPEWGNVLPFAMTDDDLVVRNRDGHEYTVYKDPGEPAYIDTTDPSGLESFYKWNFTLVPVWQSHLDTSDNVFWDISPNSIGNIQDYPNNQEEYEEFYNFFDGGDPGEGYDLNPITGEPYEPQLIRRADYGRVLAEFWADGPESVTPPGHWFKIYNEVSDHPLFERNWEGQGPELDALEYDVKAYLAIGGAMHDAAIAAWSIKGYYDYLRPVSAVRFMADRGQCTDPELPNYHPAGIPLIPGYIELVEIDDPLAGLANQNAGKIKLYTWRGPDYIDNPNSDESGVGWILAENWWPYQRPSFVTPPFAGYISGHSTYSRTAAEVMTLMTGSPFFPGGMSGFEVEKDEFLVFENGPSETFQLQWATYMDASDQCSLSRIWGGIHPPIDDIPGRKIGMELGPQCFNFANGIIQQPRPHITNIITSLTQINQGEIGSSYTMTFSFDQEMDQSSTPQVEFVNQEIENLFSLQGSDWITSSTFELSFLVEDIALENISSAFKITGAFNQDGVEQNPYLDTQSIQVDTKLPEVIETVFSQVLINDDVAANGQLSLQIDFSETCNTEIIPQINLLSDTEISSSLVYSESESSWLNNLSFLAVFDVMDFDVEASDITLEVLNAQDLLENNLVVFNEVSELIIDTKNPILQTSTVSDDLINIQDIGTNVLIVSLNFDDEMDTSTSPQLIFEGSDPTQSVLLYNATASQWLDAYNCDVHFNIDNASVEFDEISFSLQNFLDVNGNSSQSENVLDLFKIDTKRPEVVSTTPSTEIVSDQNMDGEFYIDVLFSENMDTEQAALIIPEAPDLENSLSNNFIDSEWIDENTFRAHFNISDQNAVINDISISADFGIDISGNSQEVYNEESLFDLDTENPQLVSLSSSDYFVEQIDIGSESFEMILIFQEPMLVNTPIDLAFSPSDPVNTILEVNAALSNWLNEYTYKFVIDVNDVNAIVSNVGLELSGGSDLAGNSMEQQLFDNFLSIDTEPLSASHISRIEGIEVFPTILTDGQVLNIRSIDHYKNYVFRLFDSSGKKLIEYGGTELAQGITPLEIGNFQSGLYIYEVRIEDRFARGKIFVK